MLRETGDACTTPAENKSVINSPRRPVSIYRGAVYCEPIEIDSLESEDPEKEESDLKSENAYDGFRSAGGVLSNPVITSDLPSGGSEEHKLRNATAELQCNGTNLPKSGKRFVGTISLEKYISWYTADRRQRVYSPNLAP